MSHEALAGIDCDFDTDQKGERIILSRNGEQLVNAYMQSDGGRKAVAAFFDQLLDGQLRGPTKMVCLDEGAFTDTQAPLISLGGSASLAGFADLTGTRPDSRRFRLNIIFETTTPFEEASLIGKTLHKRCAGWICVKSGMCRWCLNQGAGQFGDAGIMRQQQQAVRVALGIDSRA